MAAPRFMQRIAGVLTDLAAAVVGGGASANMIVGTNASGVLDASFFPAGFGADIVTMPASEALSSGALVNIFNNAGVANARNADSATGAAGKKVDGFVLQAVASGATASVYRSGLNTAVTGLTQGADYYLGASGAVSATAPSASGQTSQFVGKAITATSLDVQPQAPIAIQ